MLPTSSLSNGSLVTTVNLLDPISIEEQTRKCSSSRSLTMSRNFPFTKVGGVRELPLDSPHKGRGLSPYQAQTCRRLHAGSRLRRPANDSAVGVAPRSNRAASSLVTAAFAASRLLNWEWIRQRLVPIPGANLPPAPCWIPFAQTG